MDRIASLLNNPPAVSTAVLTGGLMLLAVGVIVAVALALRSSFGGKHAVVERLERTVGQEGTPVEQRPQEPKQRSVFVSRLVQSLGWIARPTKAAELSRLRSRLQQAGYRGPYALESFLATKLILAAIITIVFLQVHARFLSDQLSFPVALMLGVWICGGSFLVPNLWLSAKLKERQGQIERGLPDAMDLLVTCVEAGLGIDSAIARVSEEIGIASQILGAELNLTFLEVQAGIPRPDAFRRLAERTGVEDLRALSAMLIQTEMFGTSVARALRVHSDGMRVKRMQRAEEMAAMVGVKMTLPLILCILPALAAVLVGPALVNISTNLFTRIGGGP
jgi:tight adherence protein C